MNGRRVRIAGVGRPGYGSGSGHCTPGDCTDPGAVASVGMCRNGKQAWEPTDAVADNGNYSGQLRVLRSALHAPDGGWSCAGC